MPVLPPKRIVAPEAPPAPAPAPEAAAPAAPPAPAAVAPAEQATPAAAPAPESTPAATNAAPKKVPTVKTPKAKSVPAKLPPKKLLPAKKVAAPAKKAPPVKKVAAKAPPKRAAPKKASTPRPATENVVPKVLKVKTRIWSDEAVELGTIIVESKRVVPAITKERVEIRNVGDRLQVMLNEKLGLNCRKVYSNLDDIGKIVKFLQRIPEELLPVKWPTAFERIEKFLAKNA